MRRARVNGVELEYEVTGSGEPVLLVHGSHIARSFLPLQSQPALTSTCSLVRYHRRGFLGSQAPTGPVRIEDQAADALALLEHLGLERAHVVGHSYGGPIALQLAADAPSRVASLVLLEAALLTVPLGQAVVDLVAVATERYLDGDWEAAQDLFLGSPAERATLARHVPGSLEQALRDTDTYFRVEVPAHEAWRFTPEQAARYVGPVLFVNGSESSKLYLQCRDQVQEWLPQTETAVLPDASHLLHLQQPAAAAALLADFVRRHPIGGPVPPPAGSRPQPGQPGRRDGRIPYNAAVDLLEGNLSSGRGDRPAIRTAAGDTSYDEMAAQTDRMGNALIALGVRPEERVLLALLDGPEFAATFFGAIKCGAVPVPVNTNLSAEEYAYLLDDSRATAAVVSEPLADAFRAALRTGAPLRHLVVVGEAGPGEMSYDEVTAAATGELSPADTTRDDVGFWLYSSGTTGRPKGVVHLQPALRFCADAYARGVLGLSAGDATFSVSKLYFAYGLGNGLAFPFAVGATAVLTAEPVLPRVVFDVVRRHRPSVYSSVPSSYANLLAAPDSTWRSADFSSVRLCVSAGEALPGALLARWHDRTGLDIVEGIGSTESCHIFISNRPGDLRPDSSGSVVAGYDVRVVDELTGRDVPAGEPGMLHVRGDSICASYWRQPALTRETLVGEWLRTGDVFVEDGAGHYSFRGRGDDLLKVGGIWVSPFEIEQVLAEDDRVRECAVVGVPDRDGLVKPEAFVVLDQVSGADLESVGDRLRQRVRQRLGGNKTPRTFHWPDALPRTETGKLRRAELRELAARR